MTEIAILQKFVAQHGHERRRKRHREPPWNVVALQTLEHVDKRNVGLGDGLIKPGLFEKILVLRMADEWQMSVKDYGKKTFFHSYLCFPVLRTGAGLSVLRLTIGVMTLSSTPSADSAWQSKMNFPSGSP